VVFPLTAASGGGGSGSGAGGKKGGKKSKRALSAQQAKQLQSVFGYTRKQSPLFQQSTKLVWENVAALAKSHFAHEMKSTDRTVVDVRLLRSVCRHCGITLRARDYKLNGNVKRPFEMEDVVDLFPKSKTALPRADMGHVFFDQARNWLSSGRFEQAYDLMCNALFYFQTSVGTMHEDTAHVFEELGNLNYRMGDREQAYLCTAKATIIRERVLGLDHYSTVECYTKLAKLAQALQRPDISLKLLGRVREISPFTLGIGHPKEIDQLQVIAHAYQDGSENELAEQFLLATLERCKEVYGDFNLTYGETCHRLAVLYGLSYKLEKALNYAAKYNGIVKKILREDDPRVKESELWLKEIANTVVQIGVNKRNQKIQQQQALQLKKEQEKKLRQQQQLQQQLQQQQQSSSSRKRFGKTTKGRLTAVGKVSSQPGINRGEKSIDEILAYINGPNSNNNKNSNNNGNKNSNNNKQKSKNNKKQ